MIKIINKRDGGSLYHYHHFLCDCLFPEIINETYNYNTIYRNKTIGQTLGIFNKIYEECLQIKNIELEPKDFNALQIKTITYPPKTNYMNIVYFNKFRNYIFNRYNINPNTYNLNYPEVLLIKRGNVSNLIQDEKLSKILENNRPRLITNGKQRREIKNIEILEKYLKIKYKNKFKAIFFENLSFEEQIKYFNNAKIIICAHGAVMSNMFFCKPSTTIIEVTCNTVCKWFDIISKILKLNHIKCHQNNINSIIYVINNINKIGLFKIKFT